MNLPDLPWLPEPPANFPERIAALAGGKGGCGEEARQLAAHRLGSSDTRRLSRAITRWQADAEDTEPLARLSLLVLSGSTFDFIADALPAAAARHSVALHQEIAPAGLVEQTVLAMEQSASPNPDAVLFSLDHIWFGFDRMEIDPAAVDARLEEALSRIEMLIAAVAAQGAMPLLCSLPAPAGMAFGSYDRGFAGSPLAMIAAFNARLPALAQEHGGILFDVAHIASNFGLAAWHDARARHLYKLPFSPDAVPVFADRLGALLGAIRGKARKCLVLDLDNTCWGGVIGDDGLESIQLGADNAVGAAHLAVQQAALMLKSRGIILAVCSKNDEANARLPFRDHPDMLLSEADIAVFQANWHDKASNLEAIAEALSIGVDALVLLDDNAAERAAVRAALPMVAVPELPADPAEFAPVLLAAGYFEAIGFSAEDRGRSQSYQANAQRANVRAKTRDLGDYLSGLEMRISHAPFDAIARSRIAQLVNKSNQFNLTTQRYTDAQIAAFENDPDCFTQQSRLSDKFGDFGMIGVVIARAENGGQCWHIDSWLMSCRVLGRRVEESMLADLVAAARDAGAETITATYFPTAKNTMVAEHYDRLGFERIDESSDGERRYRLEIAGYGAAELPFAKMLR